MHRISFSWSIRSSSFALLAMIAASLGCDSPLTSSDSGPRADSGPPRDAGLPRDTGPLPDIGSVDAFRPASFAIVTPRNGDLVLETAVVDIATPMPVDTIEVAVMGEAMPRCTLASPATRCLVHLDPRAAGSVTIVATARRGGAEAGRAEVTLTKESAFTDECPMGDAACVNDLAMRGEAAGWVGVRYENMDGLHASLDTAPYMGTTRIENGDALSGSNPGRRMADMTAGILLGNASVAVTSSCCFSVPRISLDLPAISERFRENKLWWYPEHRDHGYEDFYFASTVTVGISQGSSGSEIDELNKLMLSLGALRPDARMRLETEGQIWSALQYASRRTRVAGDQTYLETAAHPNAIADAENRVDMIQMARAFRSDRLPPVARVSVNSEDFMPAEQRLTTPESIARIWSDTATTHVITASAMPSVDASGRPLTYHWVVLRARGAVDVETTDAGRSATITIRRHAEETLILNGQPRRTSLGVVALFVHNGLYFSPPAFITSFTADPSRPAPDDNNLD